MIKKINCQNDTDLQKSSQLTQPGRNFWLCFNVLREFSDNSSAVERRGVDCTEFLKDHQACFLNLRISTL